jgi:hypothetical protein
MSTRLAELERELKRHKPESPALNPSAHLCGHYPGEPHDWRCRELDEHTRAAFRRLTRAIAALLEQRS